jgi:hypothetical protein
VYTDDKDALLEAINQSDERLSATELVNGQLRLGELDHAYEMTAAKQQQEREEPTYDR